MLDAALAFLPVLAFLAALVSMDGFKLVAWPALLRLLASGAALGFLAGELHGTLLDRGAISPEALVRTLAPVTEELLKAVPVLVLLLRRRVGFLVDAAIIGFAVGAGFALAENLEYLLALPERDVTLWIVRGFGTAVLHGGTAAIAAILAKDLHDRRAWPSPVALLAGLAAAIPLHALFNQVRLSPMLTTVLLFATLPALLVAVFVRSEKETRAWLGSGFDADLEFLQRTLQEDLDRTPVGRYLLSLKSRFPGPVVGDMHCLVRIRFELAVRAKGLLLAREVGLSAEVDEEVAASLQEMRYLERSIGRTGLLALQPLLPSSSRDRWQVHLLERAAGARRG